VANPGVTLEMVAAELARRRGVSGLDETAARTKSGARVQRACLPGTREGRTGL
jgi:hypothetical protein